MNWIVSKMKWVMLVCGVLTCTMLYAAIAPHAALQSTFGDTLQGPLAEIIVRNWGMLITLVGAMLIQGLLTLIVMSCDELLRSRARRDDRRVLHVHKWRSNDALERNSSSHLRIFIH